MINDALPNKEDAHEHISASSEKLHFFIYSR